MSVVLIIGFLLVLFGIVLFVMTKTSFKSPIYLYERGFEASFITASSSPSKDEFPGGWIVGRRFVDYKSIEKIQPALYVDPRTDIIFVGIRIIINISKRNKPKYRNANIIDFGSVRLEKMLPKLIEILGKRWWIVYDRNNPAIYPRKTKRIVFDNTWGKVERLIPELKK